jgi:hypothetical protein
MTDWHLPWKGGCRCGATRIPRDEAADADHGLPLRGLPEDERRRLLPVGRRPPPTDSR